MSGKPILCCFMGVIDVSAGVKFLQERGIPVFRLPENAAKAFGALYRYYRWLNRQHLAQFSLEHRQDLAGEIIRGCLSSGRLQLGERDGLDILRAYGFRTLPTRFAADPEEAVSAAEEVGLPVAMKVVSPEILHKSDAKGVVLQLRSPEEIRRAFRRIQEDALAYNPSARVEGVLVQKMASPGTEVILGTHRYPVFGPLLMFGIGGIFVEVFQDVEFRLAPIGRNEARRMIRKIKGYRLLEGFRGRPRTDVETLEKSLVSLSDLVMRNPEILELDINPLLIHPEGEGATVADCRIILKGPDGTGS